MASLLNFLFKSTITMTKIDIRKSTSSDLRDILNIQIQAFGEDEGNEIAGLVDDLFNDPTAMPLLSLVALNDNQAVGHILFTQAKITDTTKKIAAVILAPLAVIPTKQCQGIGEQLISEGLKILAESGIELVFVLGHPKYYPRHGFKPAGALGFEAPYLIPPQNADAWMVQELVEGTINTFNGKVLCAKTMDKPEYWRE